MAQNDTKYCEQLFEAFLQAEYRGIVLSDAQYKCIRQAFYHGLIAGLIYTSRSRRMTPNASIMMLSSMRQELEAEVKQRIPI